MAKQYWLFKSDPDTFGLPHLKRCRDQTTLWDGVRNYQARNLMRAVRKGDPILFYHSQLSPPEVVATAVVVREAYPDWILMGNVACNSLQDVHEDEIRASVRYCMEHGGIGRRYIFSASNVIYDGMPVESYRIMLDEYRICTERRTGP